MLVDRIKQREIPEYLEQYRTFICGSARGCMAGTSYQVWSYNTKIAEVDMESGELTYFDNHNYSATTHRLQKAVTDVFGS